MLSGRLSEKITIQQRTYTKDAFLNKTETWADLKTVWAEVIYTGGNKGWNADLNLELDTYTTKFSFRYFEDFNTYKYDCQIVFDSLVYDILDVEILRRKQGFIVTARRNENK